MMSQVVSLLDLAPLETGLGFGALNVHQCCCDFTVTLKPGQPQCSKKPVTHEKKDVCLDPTVPLQGYRCAARPLTLVASLASLCSQMTAICLNTYEVRNPKGASNIKLVLLVARLVKVTGDF